MEIAQIIDIDYAIENEKSYIYLAVRTENGEKKLIKEEFLPYFFAKESDSELIRDLSEKNGISKTIEASSLKSPKNENLIKITFKNPQELKELRDILNKNNIETFESDIRLIYRYLIDKNIKHFIKFKNNYVERIEFDLLLPIVVSVMDIETVKDEIKIATIITKKYFYNGRERIEREKLIDCLVVKNNNEDLKNDSITLVENERELIQKIVQILKIRQPDILTGWNFIDFDLKMLIDKGKKYGIKLDFGEPLGNKRDELQLKIYTDFIKTSEGNIFGTVIWDGIEVVSNSFLKLEEYNLDYVAKELIGEGKIDIGLENKNKNIERLYNENLRKLIEYNINDCELVFKILEKYDLIELQIERVKNTGLPLKKVFSSVVALDSLYLRKARERGIAVYNAKYAEKERPISGGYVMEPKPGIYEFVNVYDFKSLYPSIIRTFNIDPLEFEKGDLTAPNGARFGREKGILPEIIEELFKKREIAIKNNRKLESQAIKIIMNSFYGVLANPSCRFFNPLVADAITSFGRLIIKTAASFENDRGFEVIYGDTDSIFVKTFSRTLDEAKKIGEIEEKNINEFFKEWCQKNYGVESKLMIEYEKSYVKLILPESRLGGSAKKRYAGLIINKDNKEELEITGLEGIRSDWTDLAKEVQTTLIWKLFHNENIEDYLRELVQKLKNGKFDEKLIYRKSLRKDIDEYTKTTPPHVKAARMLDQVETPVIKYIMTINGPQPVEKITSSIDYEHYIEKQIKPVANQILKFVNKDFDSIFKGQQRSLFEFKK
ncbi:MAG: DNA polymerase II [Candidatus Woesearchaeota archaeon]